MAESPGDTGPDGRWYARGSIVAIDELATNRSDDRLNEGIGWTVPVLADAIKAMCRRWKINPGGVADDAIFAKTGSGAGCIADEFSREGIYFDPRTEGRPCEWLAAYAPPVSRCWQARSPRPACEPGVPLLVAHCVVCGPRPQASRGRGQQRSRSRAGRHALRRAPIEWAKDIKVQWNRW